MYKFLQRPVRSGDMWSRLNAYGRLFKSLFKQIKTGKSQDGDATVNNLLTAIQVGMQATIPNRAICDFNAGKIVEAISNIRYPRFLQFLKAMQAQSDQMAARAALVYFVYKCVVFCMSLITSKCAIDISKPKTTAKMLVEGYQNRCNSLETIHQVTRNAVFVTANCILSRDRP